jgi:hypothetical protein
VSFCTLAVTSIVGSGRGWIISYLGGTATMWCVRELITLRATARLASLDEQASSAA